MNRPLLSTLAFVEPSTVASGAASFVTVKRWIHWVRRCGRYKITIRDPGRISPDAPFEIKQQDWSRSRQTTSGEKFTAPRPDTMTQPPFWCQTISLMTTPPTIQVRTTIRSTISWTRAILNPFRDSRHLVSDLSTDKQILLQNLGGKRSCVEAVTSGHKASIEQRTRDEGGVKRSLADQKGSDDGRFMVIWSRWWFFLSFNRSTSQTLRRCTFLSIYQFRTFLLLLSYKKFINYFYDKLHFKTGKLQMYYIM